MKASLKQEDYPRYFKTGRTLLAFTGPDKMFKIEPIGSNKNPGVCIDHYITRNMVLRHFPYSHRDEISASEFSDLYKRLFNAYLEKITL